MLLGGHVPALAAVPWQPLGSWPTRVVAIDALGARSYWKCEGDAHPAYGGNKIRTLEAWLGHARARGARRLWAIGARGSNHAVATVVHARAAGLDAGAILFPQPDSTWARENHATLRASGCELVDIPSIAHVPYTALRIARRAGELVMPPGGATPIGTFGALAAAFELAAQVARAELPPPARIVVAAGSTCTSAGLLAGLALARAHGAWRWDVPTIHAVRVTPWPVTSRASIVQLAVRTLARAAAIAGVAFAPVRAWRELSARLVVDGGELGRGYGEATIEGAGAIATFARAGAPRLDGVYSGKAAAALLRLQRVGTPGPIMMWATKSST